MRQLLARRTGLVAAIVLLIVPVACTADSSSGREESWTRVERAAPERPPANVPASPLAAKSARAGRIPYPVEGAVDIDLSDVRRRWRAEGRPRTGAILWRPDDKRRLKIDIV